MECFIVIKSKQKKKYSVTCLGLKNTCVSINPTDPVVLYFFFLFIFFFYFIFFYLFLFLFFFFVVFVPTLQCLLPLENIKKIFIPTDPKMFQKI